MNDIPEPIYLSVSDNMAESLNNLCEVVNDWAGKKGWNEPLDSTSHKMEQLMLMTTELAECAEYIRVKEQPAMDDKVPSISGESAELADVLIRIFHYCGKRGINLGRAVQLKHTYNTTRPYRHGKNC